MFTHQSGGAFNFFCVSNIPHVYFRTIANLELLDRTSGRTNGQQSIRYITLSFYDVTSDIK